jgi:hypothetical protein
MEIAGGSGSSERLLRVANIADGNSCVLYACRLWYRDRGWQRNQEFDGKDYLMEYTLRADFAIMKAWKESFGNLVFRKTTRNFSTSMAKAADFTIAEVEELVYRVIWILIRCMWQEFMSLRFRETIMKNALKRKQQKSANKS